MTIKGYTFLFHASFEQGHHLYRDEADGELVIADHSGDYRDPTTTDDGALKVDFTREITPAGNGTYYLPVKNESGVESSTISKFEEIHRIETLAGRLLKRAGDGVGHLIKVTPHQALNLKYLLRIEVNQAKERLALDSYKWPVEGKGMDENCVSAFTPILEQLER